jgi:uncharacterized protein (TIGR03437 family)
MDAAQTILKKIAFFVATALLLTAPHQAFAAVTLSASSTTVTIGSASCNDYQNVTITSSDGSAQTFTVAVNYGTTTQYGNWLYASVLGNGSTNNASTFNANTGTAGSQLTIGLEQEIGTATPTATVVITPTGSATGTVSITVYYTQTTSCGGNTGSVGNNYVTVTPGSISISSASPSQSVTIQNISGSPLSFGWSFPSGSAYLSASATTTQISAGGSVGMTVTGTASNTAGAGTYNGSLVITPSIGGSLAPIPVTFTVGSGGTTSSGTLLVGGTGTSTYTTSLTDVAGNAQTACISLQDSNAGSNSYYLSQASSTGNWLLANYQISVSTPASLQPGQSCVTLSLSNAANSLASGVYSGSVALTSSSGSTATINVNLYVSSGAAPGITVQQGEIYVFPQVAPSSSVTQYEVFNVTAQSGYNLGTPSLTSSQYGFSMNTPVFSNNTVTFTVTSNSSGLAAGVYNTTVTIPSSYGSGSSSTTTITIVLPVGAGGTTTSTNNGTTTVAPTQLAFQQQLGSTFWTSGKEAQALTITGGQGTTWTASISYVSGSNWLNIDSPSSQSGTFGNGPATVLVDLFNGVGNLSASSSVYQATVAITTSNGTYNVPVTLLVTATNVPVLLGNPASATFNVTSNAPTASQTVTIVGSDNTGSTTSPSISVGNPTASWVTATASGNQLTLAVNGSNQTTGVYSATVPVSSSAYTSPIQYPVVLVVNGGGGTGTGSSGPLTLSATSLPFTNVTGVISTTLNVTASTNTYFTLVSSETNCNTASWLTVNTGSYTASTTVTAINVQVNPYGIANGTTCNGVLSLVSSTATQTVNVSMTVGTSTGSGSITVSPTTMTFAYTQGQSVPAAQTVSISNTISGSASIPFTVSSVETSGNSTTWLIIGTTSASTPYNLSVSVAPGSLSPGTYNGTVTVTPTGGTAQTIAVTLTITGSAVVTATVQGATTGNATNMALTYQVGGTSPTGVILVSAGGATAGFTATASSSQGWLQVSPTSGTTATSGTNNLTVSVVSTVLSSLLPSTTAYTGTVTIAPTAPATGTTIINVSLTVSAPLPSITGVTNAASGAVGAVSPGELISIFANPLNPIGPANAVQLSSSTCNNPCTLVPTTMGGVTVKFLPGGWPAPLTYVSAGQINAVVPYEIAGQQTVSVEVFYLNQTSNAFNLNVAATAPGIFTANSSGTGPAALLQYDASGNYQGVNSAQKPASKGWYLVIYMTGEGKLNGTVADGAVTGSNPPTPIIAPTGLLIGGQPASIAAYSEAPGIVSGVLQINAIVPANAGTSAQPLSVSFGSTASQANVTVYLQ